MIPVMLAKEHDRLGAIEAFVAVGNHLNFSAAAGDLGISASALSRRISKLEERLNCRLFQRSTRHVSFTEAGLQFFESCRELMARADEAEAALSEHATEPVGLLRVRAPVIYGQRRIAPLLASFMATHPKVRVELTLNDLTLDPAQSMDDVSLRVGTIESGDFVARPLETIGTMLCASPRYLSRRAPPTTPEALAGHDCLQYRYAGSNGRWRLSRGAEHLNLDVQPLAVSNDILAIRELAVQDRGIALLPRPLIADELDAGRLVQVLPQWGGEEVWVYLVYSQARHLPRRARAFVDYLLKAIAAHPMRVAS